MGPDVRHERWQEPAGSSDDSWVEGHRLHVSCRGDDAVTNEEIVFEIERSPATGRAAFRVAVISGDPASATPIVGMIETRIAAPSVGWEIRASGLWADHICEDPLVHWSYGLEAFAIGVDDLADLTESGFGERLPIGWELEFEAGGDAFWATPDRHYLQPGDAHGIMLSKHGDREIAGPATRQHWWGSDPGTAPQPFLAAVQAAIDAIR